MKFTYVSDLHLEFPVHNHMPPPNTDGSDLLVLAGDICIANDFIDPLRSAEAEKYRNFFTACCNEYELVVYVLGNHEYYHGDWNTAPGILHEHLEQKFDNLHFLWADSVPLIYKGVQIIGDPLWTDLSNESPVTVDRIRCAMADYKIVTNGYLKLHPDVTSEYSINARVNLFKNIDATIPTLVVTHHSPSYQSCAPWYKGDALNAAFMNNMDHLIEENQNIKAWVHGHLHNSSSYIIGECNILCNPGGYGSENPNFDFQSIFNIE